MNKRKEKKEQRICNKIIYFLILFYFLDFIYFIFSSLQVKS